uniref:Uncharacterized protein n=2 Tax=Alexandrium monilatum TaxID=311494 RepID=A0A7S4PXR8_9DINO
MACGTSRGRLPSRACATSTVLRLSTFLVQALAPAAHNGTRQGSAVDDGASACGVGVARVGKVEEKGRPQKVLSGTSISVMVVGAVVFLASLHYLVHWPDKEIRLITWKLISSTTSIFIAVMIYTVALEELGDNVALVLGHGYTGSLGLLVLLLVVQADLFMVRKSEVASASRCLIGGHLLGFNAIHVFGNMQERLTFFCSASWRAALVIPLFAAGWFALSWVARRIRHMIEERLASSDPRESQVAEFWEDQCFDTENDVVAITMGFLLTQVVGFVLHGRLPPLVGEFVHHADIENHLLFATGAAFMLSVFGFEALDSRAHGHYYMRRLVLVVRGVLAMSMSWCWLMWSRWHLWMTLHMEELLAKVVLACGTSLFCMIMVFILDSLADRSVVNPKALRAVIQAFGLLIGLSWESCFDAVMEDLHPKHFRTLIAVGLALYVLPGWRLYILPKALAVWPLEMHNNPPSAIALCKEDEEWQTEDSEDDERQKGGDSSGDSASE